MSFLEEVERVQDKLPARRLSRPMLVGIVCLAAAIVMLTALGVASTARGDFVVGNTASSSSAATETLAGDDGVDDASGQDGTQEQANESASSSSCFVYVVGAVKKPGVYELDADSRVNDAVSLAGGFDQSADRAAVNLARPIVDGEQIYIPEEGEQAPVPEADESSKAPSAGTSSGGSSDGKVNINSATESELESLPGIGEVMAGRIVEDREEQGPFAAPEDLMRVSGIGEKKYASIADLITV
ncbi:MAG: helix-hairpin-helix domain-containing protein [Coriobacteriia bacterium]|nr:helix-hairpin-helix domain-containing protein [Coriobacteriia bacterium]